MAGACAKDPYGVPRCGWQPRSSAIPVPVFYLSWLSSVCWVAGSLVDPIPEERQRLTTSDVAPLMAQPSLPRGQT